MTRKKLNKKSKETMKTLKKLAKHNKVSCPYCGCTILLKANTKVKRFPKTHFFKFACGFAWLYNKETGKVFTDIDWKCESPIIDPQVTDKTLKKISKEYLSKNKKKG